MEGDMAKRKAKMQRTWKTGSEYWIEGRGGKARRFVLIGKAKIGGRETLLLQPVRKAKKQH
jgi:hypothetical protein